MIVTLTMNPAVDVSVATEHVAPEHKLRCTAPLREPGGGGLNVSRALRELGGQSIAMYPAGGHTGALLSELLDASGLIHMRIPIAGLTRENLTVTETASEHRYRFVMPGPELQQDEWRACLDRVKAADPPPQYVVASGSLPLGVPDDFYRRVAEAARAVNARLVLDTSGVALREGIGGQAVYLIKPNLRELRALSGRELVTDAEQEAAARALVDDGRAECVLVSLGHRGALLVTREYADRIASPDVPVASAVGAGDSSVAGLILGLTRGDDLRLAARRAVAAGSAAVMTPGTELCRRSDTEGLYAGLVAGMH